MRVQENVRLDSTLINVMTIILAGIVLLSLRARLPVAYDYSLWAWQLSLALGAGACCTLVARRLGQAHLAWGGYLLAIGVAMLILPGLLLVDYGQVDSDALPLMLGPVYFFVGGLLVLISFINYRHWMRDEKAIWVRTLFLAGPGTLLTVLCPFVFGPRMWSVSPFGLDLVVASWIVGVGIFLAGSRFVEKVTPDAEQDPFSGSPP